MSVNMPGRRCRSSIGLVTWRCHIIVVEVCTFICWGVQWWLAAVERVVVVGGGGGNVVEVVAVDGSG